MGKRSRGEEKEGGKCEGEREEGKREKEGERKAETHKGAQVVREAPLLCGSEDSLGLGRARGCPTGCGELNPSEAAVPALSFWCSSTPVRYGDAPLLAGTFTSARHGCGGQAGCPWGRW